MNNRGIVLRRGFALVGCFLLPLVLAACSSKEKPTASEVKPVLGLPEAVKGKLQLFVLAGQSNMSGRGPLRDFDNKLSDSIFVFGNDYQWKQGYEPIDDPTGQIDKVSLDKNAGVSLAMPFAFALLQGDPTIKIGFIPCAMGGTVINQWQRDLSPDSLYGACLKRVKQALPEGTLAALLFHQGESDAWDPAVYTNPAPDASGWPGKFTAFVNDFRQDLNRSDLPVVFAQIGTHRDAKFFPNWDIVKQQQATTQMPNAVRVTTSDLELQDYVHYKTEGYVTLGQRYAHAYLSLRKGATAAE